MGYSVVTEGLRFKSLTTKVKYVTNKLSLVVTAKSFTGKAYSEV